jgi:hypothetical protein
MTDNDREKIALFRFGLISPPKSVLIKVKAVKYPLN